MYTKENQRSILLICFGKGLKKYWQKSFVLPSSTTRFLVGSKSLETNAEGFTLTKFGLLGQNWRFLKTKSAKFVDVVTI